MRTIKSVERISSRRIQLVDLRLTQLRSPLDHFGWTQTERWLRSGKDDPREEAFQGDTGQPFVRGWYKVSCFEQGGQTR